MEEWHIANVKQNSISVKRHLKSMSLFTLGTVPLVPSLADPLRTPLPLVKGGLLLGD